MDSVNHELRNRWLNASGQFDCTVTYAKVSKPKSGKQLGAIFGLIVATVKQELDDRGWDICGAAWTEEQIKMCLYHQYHLKYDTKKTLRDMDMAETSQFIDSCYHWSAGPPWHVAIPDPRPREEATEACDKPAKDTQA